MLTYSIYNYSSKINKMMNERDTEWPDKLQPAVFATNTQYKRSTGYTPFKLMFGRSTDPFNLLEFLTGATEVSPSNEDRLSDDEQMVIQI